MDIDVDMEIGKVAQRGYEGKRMYFPLPASYSSLELKAVIERRSDG